MRVHINQLVGMGKAMQSREEKIIKKLKRDVELMKAQVQRNRDKQNKLKQNEIQMVNNIKQTEETIRNMEK